MTGLRWSKSSRVRSSRRRSRRYGRSCGTSMAMTSGIRLSPRARSNAGSRPTGSGCVRRFRLADGAELREQLLTLSDADLAFSYCLLDTPVPLLNYVAHVRLLPVTDGDQTFWQWQSQFDTPAGREKELERLVGEDIYEAGFDCRAGPHGTGCRWRCRHGRAGRMTISVQTFAHIEEAERALGAHCRRGGAGRWHHRHARCQRRQAGPDDADPRDRSDIAPDPQRWRPRSSWVRRRRWPT